jgi:TrwC relaxase
MSIHKLTAGSGYDYLTRQVAALDATEKGHAGLASYYTERGESPGVWLGSGLDGIDGPGYYRHGPRVPLPSETRRSCWASSSSA